MQIDTAGWSGEGTFTQSLIEWLQTVEQVAALKVEDAPASRSEAAYNFVSNEIFVTFAVSERREPVRRLGIIPGTKLIAQKALTIAGLATIMKDAGGIGPADYEDDGMIQYLKTERIIPPYQTKGYKLVELIRIYEVGTPSRT